ncbi:hypothetical protein GCM10025795_49080 [Verticiella sediminum]
MRAAAPGLFSTTTDPFNSRAMLSPYMRAMPSVVPPAAKGTMSLMGREGYCCARTGRCTAAAAQLAAVTNLRRFIMEWEPGKNKQRDGRGARYRYSFEANLRLAWGPADLRARSVSARRPMPPPGRPPYVP